MPSFVERFGIRGAIVAGLDFMRGIGEATGMHTKEIHGATGYLNTNFREKLKYAKNFLLHNDFVLVHVNAPDEEAHAGNAANKVLALELIDREIVTPLLEHLERRYPNNFRICVLPDHYTCLADSQHLEVPVPYAMYGAGIAPDAVERYSEAAVAKVHKDVLMSTSLLEVLLSEGSVGSGDGR
jgi:2,3-bisphosphoglycerate-independent phosphoglycerate mutase